MCARFGRDQTFRPPKRHIFVSIRGLKVWSRYVCPIWARPDFQAAKATHLCVNSRPEILVAICLPEIWVQLAFQAANATQLGVNSWPESLVAICLPDSGATSISGRQSDTARCQFEAARTKIARRNPKSGIPVLTAHGKVM